MSHRSFTTSAKSVEDNESPMGTPVTYEIDERDVTFLPPTTGQWAVTLAGLSDTASATEQMGAQINFFFSMLDDDDMRYFKQRLMDREDPFDVADIAEIITALMEEWSARPTIPPSGSSRSPSTGGKRSTAVRHHSTP
jgi:hypothetical protein